MVTAKCQKADSDICFSILLHWHERPDSTSISIKSFTSRVREVRFLLLCMRFKYHKWLFNVLTWNGVPHILAVSCLLNFYRKE